MAKNVGMLCDAVAWFVGTLLCLFIWHHDVVIAKGQQQHQQQQQQQQQQRAPFTKPIKFYVLDPGRYRSFFPDKPSFELAINVAPFLDLPTEQSTTSRTDFHTNTSAVPRTTTTSSSTTDTQNHIETPLNGLSSYHDILVAYYYRVRSYRKHIHKSTKYWVVTEFLPNVEWAGAGNTISAAAGHHILEGRWFWDAPTFLEDYIRFWYLGGGDNTNTNDDADEESVGISSLDYDEDDKNSYYQNQPQPHLAQYTNWIYHAAWQYGLLWGLDNTKDLFRDTYLNAAGVFRDVYLNKYWTNSSRNQPVWKHSWTNRVCWRQDDGYDAMEVSVSGEGCRPTIASAMWGEAMALVHVSRLLNVQQYGEKEFLSWAQFSQNVITQQHWNSKVESFAVIPPPSNTKPPPLGGSLGPVCDLKSIRLPNQPVSVRELLAFMPWYYSSLLPICDHSKQALDWVRQFQWLLESSGSDGFTAPWGLRTVQRSTPCYNYSYDHGDCWNGPSWPYETSRVLTGLANLLIDHADKPNIIRASQMSALEFERLFQQYAEQHTQTRATNDTAQPPASGHIFENLHPDLGYWNNRERMYWRNDTQKDMGDDYNHSTFLDLIFASWFGIRMPWLYSTSSEDNTDHPWLIVHPIIQAPYFAADRIPYRGRVLSIVYDPDGTRYSVRVKLTPGNMRKTTLLKGFVILIDGHVVAQRSDLGRLVVPKEPFDSGNLVETVRQ